MRKFLKWSFGYALAGIAGGVLYRELTKLQNYTGATNLSFVHTHLLALGMAWFLIVALMEDRVGVSESNLYRPFMYCYNIGLILTATMLGVRGCWQIAGLPDNPAISGIAGAGHILLAAGIILFFAAVLKRTRPGEGQPSGEGQAR